MVGIADLVKYLIAPLQGGKVVGDLVTAGSLWQSKPALIFVVRRPGCPLCREHAQDIVNRYKSGDFGQVNLYAVVKEIAPTKDGVQTDAELGVGDFQEKYFSNYPTYLDSEQMFYQFLGSKTFWSTSLHTWNPFQLYSDFKTMQSRVKDKGVEGNMKGDYYLKGGVLLILPNNTVAYQCDEVVGGELPYCW